MSAHILGALDRIASAFGHGTTIRSATAEFGPTPAVRYPELARYSNAELIAHNRDELLAQIRRERRVVVHAAGVR